MNNQSLQTISFNESLDIVSAEIYITNYHAEDFGDLEEGYCTATIIVWVDFEDHESLFPIELPLQQQFETERVGIAAAALTVSSLLPNDLASIETEVNVFDALDGKLLFTIDIADEFADEE
jgi:hypothetical protein